MSSPGGAPTSAESSGPPKAALRLVRVLTVAAFIVILNETIMANAVPRIMDHFDIPASMAQWLTTAFLLTMAVTIPLSGRLLDRLGTRRSLGVAMSLFCTGTALAFVAPLFSLLLLGRVVQAMGTAIMIPLLMTTLMTVIPPEFRGRVMGSVTLAISVAPATGPLLSGLILQYLSWHWLFGLVLPIAVVIGLSAYRMLDPVETREVSAGRIDLASVALSALGFGGLVWGLVGLGEGASEEAGDPVVPPVVIAVVGAIAVGVLAWRQLRLRARGKDPLLDVTVLRHRTFAAGVGAMTIAFGAFLGVMIVLPLVLQEARGISVLTAGVVLMPAGLLMGLLGPVVGRLYDRLGPRPLVVPGATLLTVGVGLLAWLLPTGPVWLLGAVNGITGIGLALVFTPIFTASLGVLPEPSYSHGSAILATLQQVGGAAGTAAMITVLSVGATLSGATGTEAVAAGGQWALAAAAVLGALTLVLAPLVSAPESGTAGRPTPAPLRGEES